VAAAVALAVAPLGQGPLNGWLVLGLGAGGVLSLGTGLAVRWSAALATGIALLGAEQAVRLATGPSDADPWTPLYAAGFLLAAELAWWSIEPRAPSYSELSVLVNRLAAIVGSCVAGAVLAALVLLAAGAPLGGGVALELVGALAAVAALAVVATVARTRVR
jgi:hypothetical protein